MWGLDVPVSISREIVNYFALCLSKRCKILNWLSINKSAFTDYFPSVSMCQETNKTEFSRNQFWLYCIVCDMTAFLSYLALKWFDYGLMRQILIFLRHAIELLPENERKIEKKKTRKFFSQRNCKTSDNRKQQEVERNCLSSCVQQSIRLRLNLGTKFVFPVNPQHTACGARQSAVKQCFRRVGIFAADSS